MRQKSSLPLGTGRRVITGKWISTMQCDKMMAEVGGTEKRAVQEMFHRGSNI